MKRNVIDLAEARKKRNRKKNPQPSAAVIWSVFIVIVFAVFSLLAFMLPKVE